MSSSSGHVTFGGGLWLSELESQRKDLSRKVIYIVVSTRNWLLWKRRGEGTETTNEEATAGQERDGLDEGGG